jgi:hypothetical protein
MDEKDETLGQKRARQAREAARRSRAYRARKKAERTPDTRTVDAALAEGMAFELARTGVMMVQHPGEAVISVIRVLAAAKVALVRDGYRAGKSAQAVFSRVQHRPEHDGPFYVPSLQPSENASLHLPPRVAPGGPRPLWRSKDPIRDMLNE